ncbi:MAG: hypothetical protein IH624_04205 [Phycisphaerae bacterium]|nr:hypothetical protein [Phycisphaerae bacterium]
MKKVLLLVMVLCLGLAGVTSADQGKVLYKYWANINGTLVSDLVNAVAPDPNDPAPYPDNPTSMQLRDWFEAPLNNGDNFGAELSCWLIPKQTGNYAFWIASDDASELWISTDIEKENVVRVAWVDGWCGSRDFDGTTGAPGGQQMSVLIPLVEGKAYYMKAIQKEGGGGDNCSVARAKDGAVATRQVLGEFDQTILWSNDPRVCSAPVPNGSSLVPLDATALSWALPAASQVVDPVLDVYFGTDPEAMALVIDDGEAVTSYDVPVTYDYSTTYYWRIDTTNVIDPNSGLVTVKQGDLWSFTTVGQEPIITEQPVNMQVGPGCAGVFTVAAISGFYDDGGTLTYQWKKADGTPLPGETADTLVIGVQDSYYCTVSNVQGSLDSAVAAMTIASHGFGASGRTIGDEAPVIGEGFTHVNGTVTIGGAGHDIWDGNDDFYYVYLPVEGDCEISARVVSIANPSNSGQGWVKAGVMIRDSLDDNSLHTTMAMTTGNGGAWQGRISAGTNGNSSGQNGGGNPTPRWVKVVRQGNNFTGYTSDDGVNWTAAAGSGEIANPQSVAMTDPVYIGLAVTSHDSGILVTAVFDDIKGLSTTWKPRNPMPDGSSWVNPEQDLLVSWEKAELGPCGEGVTYDLIVAGTAAEAGDPNAIPLAEGLTDTQALIPAALIDYDSEYYWRVDVNYDGESEIGDVWYVQSIQTVLSITSQPVSQVGKMGDMRSFSIVVDSITDVEYAWYKVGDDVTVLGTTDTLDVVISEPDAAYYCVATNGAGSVPSNTARLILERLIAWYPLEEIEGDDVIADMSGEGHDGTVINGATIVPGMVGSAIQFDGISQHALIGSVGVDGSLPRTITCWAKANVEAAAIPDWTNIFGFTSTPGGGCYLSFDLDKMFGSEYGIHMYCSEQGMGVGTMDMDWHFLAATYDGTTVRRYFDGILVGTADVGLLTQDNVQMGRRGHDAGGYWPGIVDEARIYNYALSAVDIAELAAADSGESVCVERPATDLNGDCKTDLQDFAIMAGNWLECNLVPCDRW